MFYLDEDIQLHLCSVKIVVESTIVIDAVKSVHP